MSANQVFKCSFCDNFAAPTFGGVYRHIAALHKYDPNFHICCGIDGCPATFKKVESWRSHIFRKHRKLDFSQISTPQERNNEFVSQVIRYILCILVNDIIRKRRMNK